MILSTAAGMFECFCDVFAERVVFHFEMKGWASGSEGEAHVCVSSAGFGEENEMCDAERSCHDNVVFKLVRFSFL